MADDLMLLCNISGAEATWKITPAGQPPIEVIQDSKQYGTTAVPLAGSYQVAAGSAKATTNDPSAGLVFTGSEIVVTSAD